MKLQISQGNFLGVKNPDWWTQECPAVLQLCYGFMTGFARIGKYFKKDYGVVLVLFKNDYGAHYLDKKKSMELAESVFDDFVKNPRSFVKIVSRWQSLRRKLFFVQRMIERTNLKKVGNKILYKLYDDLLSTYIEEYTPAMVVEAFELYTPDVFYPKLASFSKEIKQQLKLLEQATFKSFITSHQIELLKLALIARKFKPLDLSNTRLNKLITKFQKKYFWLSNNYRDDIVLSPAHFLNLIITELRDKNTEQIEAEIVKISTSVVKLKKDKIKARKDLIKIGIPRDILAFYELLEQIGPWHDERKRLMLLSSHYMSVLLEEIGRRFGYSLSKMHYFQPQEIKALLLDNQKMSGSVLMERRGICVWIGTKDSEYLFSGKEAEEIMRVVEGGRNLALHKVITGLPAAAGVVQGKVRIVLDAQNNQFKDGEVLVTTMTRPEFVPLMKRAVAIVTDEGGLTCHAAIISRELGIPCVVGTRTATRALKDGDIVEVRAHPRGSKGFKLNSMDLEQIKKMSWYRQQTGSSPYFVYQPCRGCVACFQQRGRIYWFCDLDEARAYLDKSLIGQMAIDYLATEKSNPGNLMSMFEEWKDSISKVDNDIFNEIDRRGLHTMSDRELLAINKKLAEQSFVMWTKFFMDIYDVDAEGLVEKELVDAGITLTPEEKGEMLLHPRPMAFQREHLDLLRVAKLVKNTPDASSVFLYIANPSNLHRLALYPEIEQALSEHQKAYLWIRNSWAATSVVSIFDFVEMLKQVIFSARDIESECQELAAYEENTRAKKKMIADKYKMSDWLRQVFDFFGLLSYWRDERKVEMQKINHYLELFGREIGKRSGLDWDEIKVCDPILIKGIPVEKELLESCRKLFNAQFVLTWDGEKVIHLSAEDAKAVEKMIEGSIETEVTEIRGMIACPGKVEGEVVVVNGEKEFEKMKQGLILVAPMTRPEYVPLMKMAAAIVTDEGGITSHAAIVSRELEIPCIIGTQVATKKLKDGDRVLVNANHGVVIVKE